MTVSAQKIEANRKNAQRSTGPKTLQGKEISKMNAVKHGLSAEKILLSWEDPAAFETFAQRLWEALGPEDPIEEATARTIIGLRWRMERGIRAEAAAFHSEATTVERRDQSWGPQFVGWRREIEGFRTGVSESIQRYETSLEKRYFKALKEFRSYRELRQQAAGQGRNHGLSNGSSGAGAVSSSGPDAAGSTERRRT